MGKVYVHTDDYERAHNKRPRGHGCWAFFFSHAARHDVANAWFTTAMTWSQAKAAAVAEAKRRKVNDVYVGS